MSNLDEIVELINEKYPPLDIRELAEAGEGFSQRIMDYVIDTAKGIPRLDIALQMKSTLNQTYNLLGYHTRWSIDTTYNLYKAILECAPDKKPYRITPEELVKQIERYYTVFVLSEDMEQMALVADVQTRTFKKAYNRINHNMSLYALERALMFSKQVRDSRLMIVSENC